MLESEGLMGAWGAGEHWKVWGDDRCVLYHDRDGDYTTIFLKNL